MGRLAGRGTRYTRPGRRSARCGRSSTPCAGPLRPWRSGWRSSSCAEPDVPTALAGIPAGRRAVLVPLLLASGYHDRVDLPAAIAAARPGTAHASVLGPDPRLAVALADRLREAGRRPGEAVVLAAAGSSDPTAVAVRPDPGRPARRRTGHRGDRGVRVGRGAGRTGRRGRGPRGRSAAGGDRAVPARARPLRRPARHRRRRPRGRAAGRASRGDRAGAGPGSVNRGLTLPRRQPTVDA